MGIAITSRLTRGTDNTAPFSLFEEQDAALSHSTVNTISDRDAIPEWRRRAKMLVYVIENDNYYRLGTNLTIAGQVWTLYTFGIPDNVVTEDEIFDMDGYIKPDLIRNVFLNDSYVVDSEAEMLALSTVTGNFVIRSDTNSIFVKLNNDNPSDIGDFAEITYPAAVLSVNGLTGAVVISITSLIAADVSGFNTKISESAKILEIEASISDLQDQIDSAGLTFTNGITDTGGVISLGGTTTANIAINADSAGARAFTVGAATAFNSITMRASNVGSTNYGTFTINSSTTSISRVVSGLAFSLQLSSTGGLVTDGLSTGGLQNAADYRANYTSRSLADWGNVISQLGGKNLDTTVTAPGSGQNGYVLSWNNINQEYELIVPPTGTGTVTGTGVSGRVAFWSGTSAIDSDSTFTFTNSILKVPRFNNSLATAPSTNVTDGDLYYDSVIDDYRLRGNGVWTNITRPGDSSIDDTNSPYSLSEANRNFITYVNTSAGDVTIDLSSTSLSKHWIQTFVNVGTGSIILDAGTNTLNAVSNTCSTQYGAFTVTYAGSGIYFAIGALGAAGGNLPNGNGTTVNEAGGVDVGGLLVADIVIDADNLQVNFTNIGNFIVGVTGNDTFMVSHTSGIERIYANAPLILNSVITGSIPTASNYEGGVLYDTTLNVIKYSDGLTWHTLQNALSSGNGTSISGTSVNLGGTITSDISFTTTGHNVAFAGGVFAATAGSYQFAVDPTAGVIIDLPSGATGDLYYRKNTGYLARLPIGTTGQVLKVSGGLPAWGTDNTGGGGLSDGDYGDVVVGGSGTTMTIDNQAVGFSKIVNSASAGLSVIGRSTNSAGSFAEIAATTDGTALVLNGTTLGFGTIVTAGIANSAVTYAKMQNASGGTRILGRASGSSGVYAEIAATTNGQVLKRSGGSLLFGNVETVSFTVSTLPSASTAGQMIYVSDESGGAVIAFADGTNWRRLTDRAIVS